MIQQYIINQCKGNKKICKKGEDYKTRLAVDVHFGPL